MSTPTEAYYDLRRHVIFSDPDDGAELIADSEANAVAAAVTALTCIHHNDLERAACPVCLVTAITAESVQLRDQLAAARQRETVALASWDEERGRALREGARVVELKARAERAEAELTTERARLDWLMAGGVCMVQHTGGFYVSRLHYAVSRAAIDAAMKEDRA